MISNSANTAATKPNIKKWNSAWLAAIVLLYLLVFRADGAQTHLHADFSLCKRIRSTVFINIRSINYTRKPFPVYMSARARDDNEQLAIQICIDSAFTCTSSTRRMYYTQSMYNWPHRKDGQCPHPVDPSTWFLSCTIIGAHVLTYYHPESQALADISTCIYIVMSSQLYMLYVSYYLVLSFGIPPFHDLLHLVLCVMACILHYNWSSSF
jgi:hypothetical protein